MTVLFSMLSLVPGSMGGSETYARELLRELAARELDVRTLVSPLGAGWSGDVPEQVAPEYRSGRTTPERVRGLVLGMARRHRLARRLIDSDVVHYPFTVPVPPPAHGQRSVVTLHDVQHHDLPEHFSLAERVYRSWAYDRAALRADAVITVSEFCRQRVLHHLPIDPARVHVAPLGVRLPATAPEPLPREDFLLYPARGWPHKNHEVLFRAFGAVRAVRPELRLVLTAATPAELPPVPDGVDVRGQVPRAELDRLYRTAAALVFPSRYEGFGLPVLEAMAVGCPVAAARSGALPEVVGDAGVLFDSGDPDDVARGVLEALDRADALRQLGLAEVGKHTWSRCAEVHAEVYRSLGG